MMTTSHNPDIMLLDLGLPDIDGIEVIRSVRTWSNLPIIVLSAVSYTHLDVYKRQPEAGGACRDHRGQEHQPVLRDVHPGRAGIYQAKRAEPYRKAGRKLLLNIVLFLSWYSKKYDMLIRNV